jgi:hypothetical protein
MSVILVICVTPARCEQLPFGRQLSDPPACNGLEANLTLKRVNFRLRVAGEGLPLQPRTIDGLVAGNSFR